MRSTKMRFLSGLLAFLMVFSLMPMSALAADTTDGGDGGAESVVYTTYAVDETFDWSKVKYFEQKNDGTETYNLVPTYNSGRTSLSFGRTSGVMLNNVNSGIHSMILLPWQVADGDDFIFTADVTIESYTGQDRWMALSIANQLNEAGDKLLTHYQLVTRFNGTQGGITHLNSVTSNGWDNLTDQVLANNAPSAYQVGKTYTLKAVVSDNVVNMYYIDKETGTTTQTLKDYDLANEARTANYQRNSAGYLGLEFSGCTVSINYDNTKIVEPEDPNRYDGYSIYEAKTGYTVDDKALSFKDDVTAYFMYNGTLGSKSYSGMNIMGSDETELTKREVWGNAGLLQTQPGAGTAFNSATVNFGDTSGARVYTQNAGSAVPTVNLLMPWAVEEGENFVYSADIKIVSIGAADRWIALTLGNKVAEDGSITQQYQAVTRVNGVQAGLTKGVFGEAIEWTNYPHNNGAQAPVEALPALAAGDTYRLKVVGENKNIDGEDVYVLNSYIDDYVIMENWEVEPADIAGYLGIEANGVVFDVDYDDTVVEKRDTTGYTVYELDKETDYSGTKLFTLANPYKAGSPVTYGLTGFAGTAGGTNNLVFPYEVGATDDVVFTVPIKVTETDANADYLALTWGNKLVDSNGAAITGDDISGAYAVDALYHCNMRKQGSNAGISRWDGGWQDLITEDRYPGIVPFTAGQTYVFEVVITDGHIIDYYIDDVAILRDVDLNDLADWTKADANAESSVFNTGFPTDAAGYLGIHFKSLSIEVAYEKMAGAYEQEYYRANSAIKQEAIVAWETDSTYADALASEAHPAHYIINIDENLAVTAMDGSAISGDLKAIVTEIGKANGIPMISVDNKAEAEALAAYVKGNNLIDLMVISSDIEALNYVLENTMNVRGVYDVSAETKTYTEDELEALMYVTNTNQAKIILMSEESADYASVRWLQSRMMTVWGRAGEGELSVLNLLTNGIDGIITDDYADVFADMKLFTGTNVLLRVPTVSGHRGSKVAADGGAIPEVTVPALLQATEFGADAVECDIYSTSDGILVLDHDGNTNRMMTNDLVNGEGATNVSITGNTYQYLYDNLVFQKQWSHDKDGNFIPRHINTLEEQFAAFVEAGYDDVVFYLEFKNSSASIKVNKVENEDGSWYYQYDPNGALTVSVNEYSAIELKRLAQKYGVEAQCLIISFDVGFLQAMNEYYPEMSQGYLLGAFPDSTSGVLTTLEATNSCADPSTIPSVNTLRGMYTRGVTIHPWTKNGAALETHFVRGDLQSVTTDNTIKIGAWAEYIALDSTEISVPLGTAVDLGATVIDHLNREIEGAVFEIVTVSGEGLVQTEDGAYALADGDTVVMLKYAAKTDGGYDYTIYSNPITIKQAGPAGQYAQEDKYVNSDVANEAAIAWNYNSDFSADETVSHVAVEINADMKVILDEGTEADLAEFVAEMYEAGVIPMVYVDNQEEADALVAYLNDLEIKDIMIVCSDIEMLGDILAETKGARGVYDVSAKTSYTEDELEALKVAANSNDVKIIMLSDAADYEDVKWLQTRLMTVWAKTTGEDVVANYKVLTNGVDGVLADNPAAVQDALASLTGTNVLLRVPTISGHRGSKVAADGGKIPEVTVDALLQAAAFGADAVECDLLITKDGYLVLQHDDNTSRMMSENLDIKTSTLAELKELTYKQEFSQDKDGNLVVRHIETLQEQFEAFKDNKDIVFYLELKAVPDELEDKTVEVLREVIEEYGVEKQCVVITFDTGLMESMHRLYPELSLGYLGYLTTNPLEGVLDMIEPVNGTINPYYGSYGAYGHLPLTTYKGLRGQYLRGVTMHGWTINGYALDEALIVAKSQSLTTDNTIKIGDWANRVVANTNEIRIREGGKFALEGSVITWLGEELENAELTPVVVSGKDLVANADGSYSLVDNAPAALSDDGDDTVIVLKYEAVTDGADASSAYGSGDDATAELKPQTYTLYSNPIVIKEVGLAGQYQQEDFYTGSDVVNEAAIAWASNGESDEFYEASHYAVVVDANMKAYTFDGEAIGTLKEACAIAYDSGMIPMVYVEEQAVADALVAYLNDYLIEDIMVICPDIEMLGGIMAETEGARGVYDVTAKTSYTEDELEALKVAANSNDVKVIMLSDEADYEDVKWLQTRLMTVWVQTDGEDLVATYTALTNGVDGLLTGKPAVALDALRALTGTNVLLRVPTISGHRGSKVAADGGKIPEVTVDALLQAAAFGADAVECDLLITKDGYLVLQHDDTTERMMSETLDIKTSTLEELKALTYKEEYSQDGEGNFVERHIETLQEQFEAFKDNKDIVFYLELKEVPEELEDKTVEVLREVIEEYGVEKQCVVITFDTGLMESMHRLYPELSLGYLGMLGMGALSPAYPQDTLEGVLDMIEPVNGTINPGFYNIYGASLPRDGYDGMRGQYLRGVTMHGWTINGYTLDEELIAAVSQSLTTDNTIKIGDWANHIEVESTEINVRAGESFKIDASVITWLDEEVKDAKLEAVVIEGEGVIANADGTYTLVDGETVVVLKYEAVTDGADASSAYGSGDDATAELKPQTYTLYSNPITVQESPDIYRVKGDNRTATAVEAGYELKEILGVEKFNAVIIASGNNFADALGGSYLANAKSAPILLYTEKNNQMNIDFIKANLVEGGTVYVLGGEAAVPAAAIAELEGYEINRLYGNDRFVTNIKILEEVGVAPGQEIIVATGYNFADSLSASATGLPILLVNTKSNELTADQAAYLTELAQGGKLKLTIAGGVAAVSEDLATVLAGYGEVDRVYGDSRYLTAVAIAERYFADVEVEKLVVAYGKNFPDGLAAGPVAYALGMPLLLTDAGSGAEAVSEYVAANEIIRGIVMGGSGVISDETVWDSFNLAEGSEVPVKAH